TRPPKAAAWLPKATLPSYRKHSRMPLAMLPDQPTAPDSISPREIDDVGDRFARRKAADGIANDPGSGRRMRLRRDVRRHDDPRMVPERVPLRQRPLPEHVEHRPRQLPAVERRDQIGLDEMAAAPGIDETRAARQAHEQAGIQDALG